MASATNRRTCLPPPPYTVHPFPLPRYAGRPDTPPPPYRSTEQIDRRPPQPEPGEEVGFCPRQVLGEGQLVPDTIDAMTSLEVERLVAVASEQNVEPKVSWPFLCHVILACFVFILCGFLFGGIAVVLAFVAEKKSRESREKARCLGVTSLALSILGVLAGVTVLTVLLTLFLTGGKPPDTPYSPWNYYNNYNNYYDCNNYFNYDDFRDVDDKCRKNHYAQSTHVSSEMPLKFRTAHNDGDYCYHNCTHCLYEVSENISVQHDSRNRCFAIYYNVSTTSFCYHSCSNLESFSLRGRCESPNYNRDATDNNCFVNDKTYYDNCSAGLVVVGTKCFGYRSHDRGMHCVVLSGPLIRYEPAFLEWDPYCYWNCTASDNYSSGGSFCFKKKIFTTYSQACTSMTPPGLYSGSYCYANNSLEQY